MTRPTEPRTLKRHTNPLILDRLEMIEILTSPVRHELHQVLDLIGPASVREVAKRMGRKAETLYYHVKAMSAEGLIVVVGEGRSGRRTEKIYDVAGRPFRISPDLQGADVEGAIIRSIGARARLAARAAEAEVRSPDVVSDGNRTWRSEQNHARLTEKDRATLNRMIDDVVSFLRNHDDPDGEAVLVSLFTTRLQD